MSWWTSRQPYLETQVQHPMGMAWMCKDAALVSWHFWEDRRFWFWVSSHEFSGVHRLRIKDDECGCFVCYTNICDLRTAPCGPKLSNLLDQSGPSNPKEDTVSCWKWTRLCIFIGVVFSKKCPLLLTYYLSSHDIAPSWSHVTQTGRGGDKLQWHGSLSAYRYRWPSLWLFSDLPSGVW